MANLFRTAARAALVLCLFALAACGGGGGGSSGGGTGGNGGTDSGANFTIDRANVTFSATVGGPVPPAEIVNGTILNVDSTIFLFVTTTSNGVETASVQVTGEGTGALTIFPRSPQTIGAGTFTDTISVRACLDSACGREISGSPRTITSTYTVVPAGGGPTIPVAGATLSIDTNVLSFSAQNPIAGAPGSVSIAASFTGVISQAPIVVLEQEGPAVAAVASASQGSGAQITITPALPENLGSGTFTATVRVKACFSDPTCNTGQFAGSPQTITVTYSVGTLVPPDAVTPHVVVAGQEGQLIIRGNAIGGAAQVKVGDVLAPIETARATELRVTPPSLSPGVHPVTLYASDQSMIPFQGAVVVIDPIAFVRTTLSLGITRDTSTLSPSERVTAILYDAERDALIVSVDFTFNPASNRLIRLTRTNDSWNAPTVHPLSGVRGITLSNDGQYILAATDAGLSKLHPVTLQVLSNFPVPSTAFPISGIGLRNVALANDGVAIVSTGDIGLRDLTPAFFFSTATGSFTRIGTSLNPAQATESESIQLGADLAASGDGRSIFATARFSRSDVLTYLASTSKLVKLNGRFTGSERALAVDRTSSRVIAFRDTSSPFPSVFDASLEFGGLTFLADLASPPNPLLPVVAVNPGGTRALVVQLGALKGDSLTLRPFDIGLSGSFMPTALAQTLQLVDDRTAPKLAMTPDGRTLFVATADGIDVVPIN